MKTVILALVVIAGLGYWQWTETKKLNAALDQGEERIAELEAEVEQFRTEQGRANELISLLEERAASLEKQARDLESWKAHAEELRSFVTRERGEEEKARAQFESVMAARCEEQGKKLSSLRLADGTVLVDAELKRFLTDSVVIETSSGSKTVEISMLPEPLAGRFRLPVREAQPIPEINLDAEVEVGSSFEDLRPSVKLSEVRDFELREMLMEAETGLQEIRDLQANVSGLESRISEMENGGTAGSPQVAAVEDRVGEQQKKVEHLEAEGQRLEGELMRLRDSERRLNAVLQAVKQQYSAVESEVRSANSGRTAPMSEAGVIAEIKRKRSSLEKPVEDAMGRLNSLKRSIEDVQTAQRENESELREAEVELRELTQTLGEEKSQARRAEAGLSREISKLEREKESARKKLDRAIADQKELLNEIEEKAAGLARAEAKE